MVNPWEDEYKTVHTPVDKVSAPWETQYTPPAWNNKEWEEKIKEDEGSESKSYRLSYGKGKDKVTEDFLTGGVGHRMSAEDEKLYPEGSEIPESVRSNWWETDKGDKVAGANAYFEEEGLESIDPEAKRIVGEMMFQIGIDGTKAFTDMTKALKKREYSQAADAMLDSKWARKQTPDRAKRAAKRMRDLGDTNEEVSTNTPTASGM